MLLWLWCRLAAMAPIRPLAWEPPYTAGRAQEMAKRKKKKKKKLGHLTTIFHYPEVNKLWHEGQLPIFCKSSCNGIEPCSFIYVLSVATLAH